MRTTKLAGRAVKKITVYTNDAEHQKEILDCEGRVLVPFKAEPKLVNFGRVERNAGSRSKTITITHGDGGPLALELLPFEHKNIEATLREIEEGERYELDVVVSPPWPAGRLNTELKFNTGVAELPQDSIRVFAHISPRLSARPSRFTISQNLTSERELKAVLVWSGGPSGRVLEVTSSDPRTSVRLEERKQQIVVLSVPAAYTLPAGGRAAVTVTTDDVEVPTLSIPLFAARVPPSVRPVLPRTPPASKAERRPGISPKPPARPTAVKKSE